MQAFSGGGKDSSGVRLIVHFKKKFRGGEIFYLPGLMIRSKALQAGKGREERNHLKDGGGPEEERRGSRETPSGNFKSTQKKKGQTRLSRPTFVDVVLCLTFSFCGSQTSTHFPGTVQRTFIMINTRERTIMSQELFRTHESFFLARARMLLLPF